MATVRALIVGVTEYANVHPLSFCENDALGLRGALEHLFRAAGEEFVVTSFPANKADCRQATLKNLNYEIDHLLANAREGDRLIFGFSGHGAADAERSRCYLLPVDADLAHLAQTAIDLKGLLVRLTEGGCPATLIVDACRDIGAGPSSPLPAPTGFADAAAAVLNPGDLAPAGAWAFFSGCGSKQKAFEARDLERGVFSHFLIQALDRASRLRWVRDIDLNDVENTVGKKVEDFVHNKLQRFQRPWLVATGGRHPISRRRRLPTGFSVQIALLTALLGLAIGWAIASSRVPAPHSTTAVSPTGTRSPQPNRDASGSIPDGNRDNRTATSIQPEQLIEEIKSLQRRYVKQSVGTFAYQSFTDEDFTKFEREATAKRAADEFQASSLYPELVRAIGNLSTAQREALFRKARDTARPTFGDVGKVPADGSAQTVAGQKAELEIAREVVASIEHALASNR